MNKNELHHYQGSLPICTLCYKSTSNSIHGVDFSPEELALLREAGQGHGTERHEETGEKLSIESPSEFRNIIPLEHKEKPAPIETNHPDCYGHKCPSCSREFTHNYKCWPGTLEILHCPDCHAQASAEIHRPEDIQQLLKKDYMTAREITEILIEHEQFVVMNLIRDAAGQLREDYEERVAAHILNIERMNIANNAKKQASKKALIDARNESLTRMTPQEKEWGRRQAIRNKKMDVSKEKEKNKKLWDSSLKQMIGLVGRDTAEIKLRELYKSTGKEIPDENN